MAELTSTPIFGVTLCIVTYIVALSIRQRFNYAILNPMLMAALMVIGVLKVFDIPFSDFMRGADFVSMFLAPATAALALSMYRQLDTIKKNWLPILVGSVVGAVSAVVSVYIFCKIFNLSEQITLSILPKSITVAFATNLSQQLGGIVSITAAAVCVTGVTGAIMAPYFVKWFRVDDPVAAGLAIGASSHVLGTAKAIELGEVQGSTSGIAVGLCGLVTVIIAIFF